MAFQGMYRKGATYIVVKQVRLASNSVLEIGETVPSEKFPLKHFHLRSLFMRRALGHPDNAWTQSILDKHESNGVEIKAGEQSDVKETTKKEPVKEAPKAAAKPAAKKKPVPKKEAKAKEAPVPSWEK